MLDLYSEILDSKLPAGRDSAVLALVSSAPRVLLTELNFLGHSLPVFIVHFGSEGESTRQVGVINSLLCF